MAAETDICYSHKCWHSVKPTWTVYDKISSNIMPSVCLLMTSNRLNTLWRRLKWSDVVSNYIVFVVLAISCRKAPEGCWYAVCNYSLARVYRGLCRLVCIAEWKSVTTNTNCLHPQRRKKSTPQIRRAGGLRIHSFPFRFQVEVFLIVQEGGKLLKLATVVAVPENVSVLPFPWNMPPCILCFRHYSLFVHGQTFLFPCKLRNSS